MSRFRKICAVIWLISTIIGVGALAISWFSFETFSLMYAAAQSTAWFFWLISITLALAMLGVLILFFRIIFARSTRAYQETLTEHGPIRIARSAIEACAQSVVNRRDDVQFKRARAYIRNGKHPCADIVVTVIPTKIISCNEVSPQLQADIKLNVEKLTGNPVGKVVIDVRTSKDFDALFAESEQKETMLPHDGGTEATKPCVHDDASEKNSVESAVDSSVESASIKDTVKPPEKNDETPDKIEDYPRTQSPLDPNASKGKTDETLEGA